MYKSCKHGFILRKGYTRHTQNKKIHVPKGCINAQSQSGQKRSSRDLIIMTRRRKMHKSIRKYFGTPKCKSGNIVREGYMRKSYMRKSGVRVSRTKVAPGCINATGLSKKRGTKGKQLFILEKGTLTEHGYHANLRADVRHNSLKKAMDSGLKPLSVYRKLNALYVLNKNKNKVIASIYKEDSNWVRETPEYTA